MDRLCGRGEALGGSRHLVLVLSAVVGYLAGPRGVLG